MSRVGLRQVADAAGVSLTTASHALSGKGRVPAATRDKVREAAERLGYRPHRAARGLATGKAMTLAVQMSGVDGEGSSLIPESSYFVSLLNGASSAAADQGYYVLLAPPGASPATLSQLHIDGAIVVDPVGKEGGLAAPRIPVVATGRPPRAATEVAWVDNDHIAASRSALDHLRERGYTRPALLTGSGEQSYLQDATRGYREWCHEHGVEPVTGRVTGPPSEDAAAEAAERIVRTRPDVDAIYATLDRLAVGALAAADALGREAGPGLGIVALSDSPLLLAARPQITAVDLRPDEIGRQAARLLVNLVEGTAVSETHHLVSSRLRPRASTAGRARD